VLVLVAVVACSDDCWRLIRSATRPFIREQLPPPPAAIAEIGLGSSGGHVPAVRKVGYQATGVGPEAPPGPEYRPVRFEDYRPRGRPGRSSRRCRCIMRITGNTR
jgi:hypothetical protein